MGPVFIVGMPRSGTKLLKDLLNRHSRIALPEIETEFLPYLVDNLEGSDVLFKYENFAKFYRQAVTWRYFVYQEKKSAVMECQKWYESCGNYTAAGIFEALVRHDAGALAKNIIWGDKSPSYIRHINLINDVYPNARFIHIIRDPRDYCLSIRKAWGKNMYRAAQRWRDDVAKCRNEGRQNVGSRYFEFRYEDLLLDDQVFMIS